MWPVGALLVKRRHRDLTAGLRCVHSTGAKSGMRMAETTLNLRGLKCPLPALRTRKALSRLTSGDVLVVECTDPLSAIDIPNLLRQTKDALEETSQEAEVTVFRIRKR